MKDIKIYSLANCTYCELAKALLKGRNIPFEEIKVTRGDTAVIQELAQRTGMKTFPQIFAGEKLIGGYSELMALNDRGMLNGEDEVAPKKSRSGGCCGH